MLGIEQKVLISTDDNTFRPQLFKRFDDTFAAVTIDLAPFMRSDKRARSRISEAVVVTLIYVDDENATVPALVFSSRDMTCTHHMKAYKNHDVIVIGLSQR